MKKSRRFLIFLFCVILIFQVIFINPSMAITPSSSDIDPSSFSPGDDNGLNDTTTITVTYTASQSLYVNIFNQTSVLVAEDRAMTESPSGSGTYVYTWNGRNDTDSYVPDGTYTIRISDNPASNGDTIGTVEVNTTAPSSLSLAIDGGNTYATSVNVNLTISATGATKMKVSNYANFTDATWENYATTKTWQLSSGDGTKTVYIDFKTTSGANASTSDTITLDTTLADPTLSINSGANSTNDRNVTLSITANGATYMKIDNDTAFTNMSSWISVATSYNFTLPAGASNPTVYLRVKDDANNQKTASDSIFVDTTAPSNLSISINSGASYTNSTSVNLTLSADGGPEIMYLSNTGSTWTEYTYVTTKAWTLSSGDGTKTVYFKAKDAAGNNATQVTSTITLDTLAPSQVTLSSPTSGATVTTQTPTFSWSNPNNVSQTRTFYIEILQSGSVIESGSTNSSTTSYTSETLAAGVYTWRVTVYDMANNSATTSQSSFTISITGLAIPSPAYPTNGAYVNASAPNMVQIRWSQVTSGDGSTVYYDYRYGPSVDNQTAGSGSTTNINATISGYTHGQTVYWSVRARNTSGSSSYCSNRSFIVDTEAPVLNSISIDSDATYASSTSVTLTLSATGASWMMISNYANFSGASWEAYSTTKSWTLSSSDGNKTVYFKAKDSAVGDQGSDDWDYPNINSSAINDTIILDTAGPTISGGSPSDETTNTQPEISADMSDEGSGVDTSSVIITVDSVNQTANATITSNRITYVPSSALSTGSHTVNITAADNLSYMGYYEWSFTVTSEQGGTPPPGGITPTITISNVAHTPTIVTSSDNVKITATITATNGVKTAWVYYTYGTLNSILMNISSGSSYYAYIGSFSEGATVTYYIHVTDNSSSTKDSSNYSFTVQDTSSPAITIISPENGSTITELKPLIKAEYSDSGGIDVTSVKITFAGTDVTDNAIVTTTYVSYQPESELTYSTYIVTVEVSDKSGNDATKEWSFTIVAETKEITFEMEDIKAGEMETWENTDETSSIEKISITAINDLEKPLLTIKTTGVLPKGVAAAPTGQIYMYLVLETNKSSSDIRSATIEFKIIQVWIQTNKIDKSTVKLLRYTDDEWQELTTTKINEDDTYVYYSAETTGFSAFAIVGNQIEEKPTELNWFIILGGVVAVVILIILVLFKSGYLYVEDEQESEEPKPKKEKTTKKK